MELSRYDLLTTKEGMIKKSCPMSKELSDKINELCNVMNSDYSKLTRDLWIRIYLEAKEAGLIDRPHLCQKVASELILTQNPYIKNHLTNTEKSLYLH